MRNFVSVRNFLLGTGFLSRILLNIVLLVSIATVGCGGRVFQVTRAKPPDLPASILTACKGYGGSTDCKLPGIPFYGVGYRCLHTTVWLQPVYKVSLVVTAADGTYIDAKTMFFGRKEFEDKNTQRVLKRAKIASQSPQDSYKLLMDAFADLQEINPLEFDTTKILVKGSSEGQEVLLSSNFVAPDRYVDATVVFFYNVTKPFAGTANAEIDLNDQGILSKASAQIEDKTLATILSALPISDLIKGAVTRASLAKANVPPPPTEKGAAVKYKIDLQLETRIYKHTHSKVDSAEKPPCPASSKLVGADNNTDYNFTVEDITASEPPDPTKQGPAAQKPNSESK